MNRYKILFTTLGVSSLLSSCIVILPFIFQQSGESVNSTLNTGAALLSGFAGCATIVVAVLLFQNIHHTNAIQRQIDTVNSFLENIKIVDFKIRVVNNGTEEMYAHLPIKNVQTLKIYSSYLQEKLSYPIAFRVDNYFQALEGLMKISNSIYMPVELQSVLNFLEPQVFREVTQNESQKFIKVVINGKFVPDAEDQTWMILCSDEEVTFKDFMTKMQVAITTMVEWLQKHSNNKLAFNI